MRRLVLLTSTIFCLIAAAAAGAATPEDLWQAARDGDVDQIKALLKVGVPDRTHVQNALKTPPPVSALSLRYIGGRSS